MNKIDLQGRKAVVTGGARGIGLSVVERMLDSGAEVALWDLDAHALDAAVKRLAGKGSVHQTAVDVTDVASVTAASQAAIGQLGRVDILINNAGITGPNVKTWEYTPEDWRKVMEVDLDRAVPVHARHRAGDDQAGLWPHRQRRLRRRKGRQPQRPRLQRRQGRPNRPDQVDRQGAGAEHVLVNCVTPAAVETEMFKQMTEEHIKFMLSKIPMGRFGKIEEIAAMITWLASEDCSFTTGGVFDISGGRATY